MEKNFKERVLKVVLSIREGSTMTYKAVATKAGSPNASRAVGTILAGNKDKKIPCHRVIRSDGKVGGYNGLQGVSKHSILKSEGAL